MQLHRGGRTIMNLQQPDNATDQWITLSYSLDAHDAGAGAGTIYERNDLDMIYIGIGGGGHTDPGTFYVRNLKFE